MKSQGELLGEIASLLDAAQVRYMVTGSIASTKMRWESPYPRASCSTSPISAGGRPSSEWRTNSGGSSPNDNGTGSGFEQAQGIFAHPYYEDCRSDALEQFRAVGCVREDGDGEHYHLVTLWRSTREERNYMKRTASRPTGLADGGNDISPYFTNRGTMKHR